MAKHKVTNLSEGPRGVHLADGSTHFVEPGETAELDVHPDHDLYEGLEKGESAATTDDHVADGVLIVAAYPLPDESAIAEPLVKVVSFRRYCINSPLV